MLEDLIAHRMAKAITWINVNICIFQVGTRLTYGSAG